MQYLRENNMIISPLTPCEVMQRKQETIPEVVIDLWNAMIVKNWNGNSSKFKQIDILDAITTEFDCLSEEVFDNHWLNVEDMYDQAGWDVRYDRPGYNESYMANYTFTPKRN